MSPTSSLQVALSFNDSDGKRYVFSKKNFDKHKKKHPELLEAGYLKIIQNVICDCAVEMIYKSYDNPKIFCYYSELATIGSSTWYNKVVVMKANKEYHIMTAFRFCGDIREKKYHKCEKTRP